MVIKNRLVLFLVLSLVCIIRIFNLESDPSVFKNTYDIHDEGWWAANAKNKMLNDSWIPGEYAGGIAVAPLNSVITYFFFKIFGINFFALRLISVFAAAGIILLFYLFLARYDKEWASTSTLLLAVNHSFFMYSRIGHVEMLLLFFIMAMFYFLSFNRKACFILAGLSWSLSILTKFSTVAFTPVLVVYFFIQWYRQKISLRNCLLFIAGALLPLMLYYVCIFLPHASQYALQFSMTNQLIKDGWHLGIHSIIMRLVFFPMTEYFMEPSIALLLILSGIFLVRTNLREKLFSKQSTLPMPILLSVIWLITWFIVLLFIDFADRRFTLFIIPLSILSGYLIHTKFKEQNPAAGSYSLFIAFILFLPLLGLHLNLHLKEHFSQWLISETPDKMNDEIIHYLSVIYAIVFLLVAIVILNRYKTNHRVYLSVLYLSMITFLSMFAMNSIIKIKDLGLFPGNKLFLAALTFLFVISFFFILFRNKNILLRLLTAVYFLFCFFAIAKDLFSPSYSIADSVRVFK